MRLVKPLLAVGLLAGLLVIAGHREPVLAAYTSADDRPPERIAFTGIDLDVGLTPVGPSPYVIGMASDTRDRSLAVTVQPKQIPTEPLTMSGGRANLAGTVVGPEGPVAGATVRVERETGRGLAAADVVTDEGGRYELDAILGGRYRLRAWLGGEYTMTTSHILFLAEDAGATIELTVGPIRPGPDLAFTHRGDIKLGATGTVAISITSRFVGDDGVVNVGGVAGATVALTPSPGVTAAAGQAITDGAGVARFVLSCQQPGPATAVVRYENVRATAVLPTCVVPIPVPDPADPGAAVEAGTEVEPGAAVEPPDHVHQRLVTEVVAEVVTEVIAEAPVVAPTGRRGSTDG